MNVGGVGMPCGSSASGLRDGGLHVDRGAVHAAVKVEFQRDLRRARAS